MLVDATAFPPPGADGIGCPPFVAVTAVAAEWIIPRGLDQCRHLGRRSGLAVHELRVVLAAVEDVCRCMQPACPAGIRLPGPERAGDVKPEQIAPSPSPISPLVGR